MDKKEHFLQYNEYEFIKKLFKYIFNIDIIKISSTDIVDKKISNVRKMCITLCTYLQETKFNIKLNIINEKYVRINEDILCIKIYINLKNGKKITLETLEFYRINSEDIIGFENYVICNIFVDYNLVINNSDLKVLVLDYLTNF